MSNIREVLQSLSDDDKRLFLKIRANMRREYIKSMNDLVGVTHYAETDDLFLDVIDNRVCELFKRGGRDLPSQSFGGFPNVKRHGEPQLSDANIAEMELGLAAELKRRLAENPTIPAREEVIAQLEGILSDPTITSWAPERVEARKLYVELTGKKFNEPH